MISVGNDIIALKYTNPQRTIQPKFYSKIICTQEAALFKTINSTQLSFENFIWLAWSIKESVYKFHKRNHAEILFSPTKIIIQKIHAANNNFLLNNPEHEAVSFIDESCFCCEVNFDSRKFFTRTILHYDLIFTVAASTNNFKNIYWGIRNIHNDAATHQSSEIRKFVLKKLNTIFCDDNLSIEKSNAGYPFIKQQKNATLSFAHHGNYVGYSFIV